MHFGLMALHWVYEAHCLLQAMPVMTNGPWGLYFHLMTADVPQRTQCLHGVFKGRGSVAHEP